jgi:hypothetical protein
MKPDPPVTRTKLIVRLLARAPRPWTERWDLAATPSIDDLSRL